MASPIYTDPNRQAMRVDQLQRLYDEIEQPKYGKSGVYLASNVLREIDNRDRRARIDQLRNSINRSSETNAALEQQDLNNMIRYQQQRLAYPGAVNDFRRQQENVNQYGTSVPLRPGVPPTMPQTPQMPSMRTPMGRQDLSTMLQGDLTAQADASKEAAAYQRQIEDARRERIQALEDQRTEQANELERIRLRNSLGGSGRGDDRSLTVSFGRLPDTTNEAGETVPGRVVQGQALRSGGVEWHLRPGEKQEDVTPMIPNSQGGYDIHSQTTRTEIEANRRAEIEKATRAVENKYEAREARGRIDSTTDMINDTIAIIDTILAHPGRDIASGWSGKIDPRSLPGLSGGDARALVRTLENRIFVDTLQAIRNNSKTGGGVGNVSDREGDRLSNSQGSLDLSQSDEQFPIQLNNIRNILVRTRDRLNEAYDRQFTFPEEDISGMSDEDLVNF